ncbi:SGNH hydrolase-type esterase domain-containing protein [Gongronella butleri]|nr:SGNH hydrolase-type esterase domain-containing protein [Gongronella butleri]
MNHAHNQVVLFGDSITQMSFDPALLGYGANIANAYQRKLDVFNRGFSGFNTDWALPLLRQILPSVEVQRVTPARIELITIFFGANDAAIPGSPQHVPQDRYKKNLAAMIDLMKHPDSPYYNPNIRIIVINPPPLDEVKTKKNCEESGEEMNRFAHITKQYADAAKEVAKEKGVPVADIWLRITDKASSSSNGLADYLFDGLHLNDNGYKELYDLLMDTIRKHYPEIHPDNLQEEILSWDEVKTDKCQEQLVYRLLNVKGKQQQ